MNRPDDAFETLAFIVIAVVSFTAGFLVIGLAMIDRRITTGARLSFTVAHVPGVTLRLDRELAFIRTCARLRWRAHESITPGLNRTRTPPVTLSAAVLLNAGSGKRTAIERTQPLVALAVRPIIQQGTRWICNFRGALQGLLSLFPSNPLVPVSPKTTSGRFQRLFFSPALCSVVAHKRNHAAKEFISVGKSVGVS